MSKPQLIIVKKLSSKKFVSVHDTIVMLLDGQTRDPLQMNSAKTIYMKFSSPEKYEMHDIICFKLTLSDEFATAFSFFTIGSDLRPREAIMTRRGGLKIPIEQTIFLRNALEHYSDVLHHRALAEKSIQLWVRPSDAGLLEKFTNVDPRWHAVLLQFYGMHVDQYVAYDVSVVRSADMEEKEVMHENHPSGKQLLEDFTDTPSRMQLFAYCSTGLPRLWRKIDGTDWCYKKNTHSKRKRMVINDEQQIPGYEVIVFEGPVGEAEKARASFDAMNGARRSTRKIIFRLSAPDQGWRIDNRLFTNPQQYWLRGAVTRKPYHIQAIYDMVMIFWEILPAYPMMWILECLPYSTLITELQRIKLIEAIISTCRRIAASKQNESNKKIK
jgi:hypothetical protein